MKFVGWRPSFAALQTAATSQSALINRYNSSPATPSTAPPSTLANHLLDGVAHVAGLAAPALQPARLRGIQEAGLHRLLRRLGVSCRLDALALGRRAAHGALQGRRDWGGFVVWQCRCTIGGRGELGS